MFPQPPFPLKREPTASAPRGATLSTRIDKYRPLVIPLRFVRQLRNNTAQSLVLRTQGLPHDKNKRTSACISKMKAKFLSCGKRSTKNQGEQLQLVVVEAKGACVRRKLGARCGRRRCGSCSVFEVAHTVYKNTPNMYPFGCGCPTC